MPVTPTPEETARLNAHERDARARALTAAGVPPKALALRNVALDRCPPETPALAAMRALVAEARAPQDPTRHPGRVVVLAGPVGTGKSAAMAWAVARWPQPNRELLPAAWTTAARILRSPSGWSGNAEAWARWQSVDLLAIDDAGSDTGDTSVIGVLLAERYGDGLVTIVATNILRADFQTRYADARLGDRLVNEQGARCPWWVICASASLRIDAVRAALPPGVPEPPILFADPPRLVPREPPDPEFMRKVREQLAAKRPAGSLLRGPK